MKSFDWVSSTRLPSSLVGIIQGLRGELSCSHEQPHCTLRSSRAPVTSAPEAGSSSTHCAISDLVGGERGHDHWHGVVATHHRSGEEIVLARLCAETVDVDVAA